MALRARLLDELRRYAIVTVYLYVCIGAVLLYRAAVLRSHGIEYTFFGLALLKALILGKFLMLGEVTGIGEQHHAGLPRLYQVLFKSVVFLALLLFLSVIEEGVKGMIHGESLAQSVSDFAGGTWGQIVASALLLWLILLPYLLFVQLAEVLGKARLREIFLTPT